MLSYLLFFFFQAEDGIRDVAVTGVQTCALPISKVADAIAQIHAGRLLPPDAIVMHPRRLSPRERRHQRPAGGVQRSEERRVGKECRSRWWRYHEKKKRKREEEASNGGDVIMILE